MHVSRGVFDVESAVRKLYSRFWHPSKVSRPEWPVISAVRPLLYLIRLFGLVPFEISGDHFIPGCYSVIYSLCCLLAQTYTLTYVFDSTVIRRETIMLETIQSLKVIFNYFVAVSNIMMSVWTRREFIRVLNIVKHFDSRLRDLGHPREEKAAKVWAWSTCVCTASIWITVNRIGMAAFNESWIYNIAYIGNYLATSLSTIKFSSVVLLLGQRFRILNKVAKRSKESAMNKHKSVTINFKVVQQLHNGLMIAGESLSSQYAWLLLLWLTNLCVHSVSNLYFLIQWIMETPAWAHNHTRWPLVHVQSWWLVTFVTQLLLIHITCHFTSDEANSIGPILINWRSFTASRNYIVESSLHHIHRKLSFSAAGCFRVNLPLLSSIAAILTTYLVLLMQFQS